VFNINKLDYKAKIWQTLDAWPFLKNVFCISFLHLTKLSHFLKTTKNNISEMWSSQGFTLLRASKGWVLMWKQTRVFGVKAYSLESENLGLSSAYWLWEIGQVSSPQFAQSAGNYMTTCLPCKVRLFWQSNGLIIVKWMAYIKDCMYYILVK